MQIFTSKRKRLIPLRPLQLLHVIFILYITGLYGVLRWLYIIEGTIIIGNELLYYGKNFIVR